MKASSLLDMMSAKWSHRTGQALQVCKTKTNRSAVQGREGTDAGCRTSHRMISDSIVEGNRGQRKNPEGWGLLLERCLGFSRILD
jgi:hypothetical protein